MQVNDIKDELSQNFIEYAVEVNTDRAIPDARSGLKPVAKRILWAAYDGGYLSSKPHVKSARVVGDTMSRWHPHGDASIYGALVRLSQDWVMRYPLIDIHGNNGNIAGDGAASMRYTEARLSKLAEDGMLGNIKKKNVDFIPNYDETAEEPVTLPALFPNLLCNPNSGIGVSISSSWAPHNLCEVAQAIYDYMDGKEPTLPGPDFPTGGLVINKDDIPAIMATGHGSVKVRAQYKLEGQNIVFYEIPYGVSTENILNEISDACDQQKIVGVSEIRDESTGKGLRLVVECKRDAQIDEIVAQLFAETSLQTSFSYNQVGLIDKTPTLLNLKDCIKIYVDFNIDCIVRETQFDLNKANERQHIVEGLLKALEDIDNIVTLIKSSKSAAAARENLIAKYNFSEAQAKAIVDMKLGRLAGLEKIELQQENQDLLSSIEQYNTLISSPDLQKKELRKRLQKLVAQYGDARRTELAQLEIKKEKNKKDTMDTPENVVISITQVGTIKRLSIDNYRIQRTGGLGRRAKSDVLLATIPTNTADTLLLFTQLGFMYKLPVKKIPDNQVVNISTLIDLGANDKILSAISYYQKAKEKYIIFTTKNGRIKKSVLDDYKQIRNKNVSAIKLKDDDIVANVVFINDGDELLTITKRGMVIHYNTEDIAAIGRTSTGVKVMKLAENDTVLMTIPITSDMVAIVAEDGMGKRCKLEEFPLQKHGGKGVIGYKGFVAGAAMVKSKDHLLLTGDNTAVGVKTQDFPIEGRLGIGKPVIQGNVFAVTKI